jgi:hypothetical protein
MKARQRTPLWLICDVAACLRLHIALGVLAMAVRCFLPKDRSKSPSPDGIVWLTAWQTGCESLLRWVIARQAFRLCGLDPRLCRSFPIAEARTSLAWQARLRAMLRMYDNMTVLARRRARRIRERSGEDSTIPDPAADLPGPDPANPAAMIFSRRPLVRSGASTRSHPAAIRGPPWPSGNRENTSPAPCRSIGEVAGVCVRQSKRPALSSGPSQFRSGEPYSPSASIAVSRPSASPNSMPGSA